MKTKLEPLKNPSIPQLEERVCKKCGKIFYAVKHPPLCMYCAHCLGPKAMKWTHDFRKKNDTHGKD